MLVLVSDVYMQYTLKAMLFFYTVQIRTMTPKCLEIHTKEH